MLLTQALKMAQIPTPWHVRAQLLVLLIPLAGILSSVSAADAAANGAVAQSPPLSVAVIGSWELDVDQSIQAQIDAARVAGTSAPVADRARETMLTAAASTLVISAAEMILTRPTVTEAMAYEIVSATNDVLSVHGADQAAGVIMLWRISGQTLLVDDVAPDGTAQRLVYVRP